MIQLTAMRHCHGLEGKCPFLQAYTFEHSWSARGAVFWVVVGLGYLEGGASLEKVSVHGMG